MERVVFVQANDAGMPYSPSGTVAARGFEYLGFTVRFFRPEEMPEIAINPSTIVVGGLGTVRAALERIGIRPPAHVSAPACLRPYLGRECWRTTVGDLRADGRYPVFLKPYEDSKVFTGRVFRDAEELERLLTVREGYPAVTEDFPLLAQEPVAFRSEWRTFVIRGVVAGVSHYEGDPLVFPAAGVIRAAIGAYQGQGAPAGYSADFGITEDGRTLLVEVNDGYSLGSGGLAANRYAELLKARWEEITAT